MKYLFLTAIITACIGETGQVEATFADTMEAGAAASTWMIVLQILTLLISLASLIVGACVQVSQNKKTLFSNQVVTQRLNDLNNIRDAAAEYLTLIDPHFVNSNRRTNDYQYRLTKAMNSLKCLLKPKYDIDREIIDLVDKAYILAVHLANANSSNIHRKSACHTIKALVVKVDMLYLKLSNYNQSNWDCVKSQADGTQLTYKHFRTIFSNNKIEK